jgi:hypothetical protein
LVRLCFAAGHFHFESEEAPGRREYTYQISGPDGKAKGDCPASRVEELADIVSPECEIVTLAQCIPNAGLDVLFTHSSSLS